MLKNYKKYSTGTLEIKILEAKLVYDTQLLGGMNTFCKYKYNDRKAPYQSETCKGGGKRPKWENDYNSIDLVESDANTTLNINSQLEIEIYSQKILRFLTRHHVKPGLTGLAQIRTRVKTDSVNLMQEKLKSDLEYINKWSFYLDIKILLNTPISMWKNRSTNT